MYKFSFLYNKNMHIKSPWLHQLKRTRPISELDSDITSDVIVVGGGIAGIATSYYILRDTKKNVTLLEAGKVAHGATGHNAGQLTSYFEQPFADLVETFGLELASQGQAAVESAWLLIEEIKQEAKLKTPILTFTGFAGCQNFEQTMRLLVDNWFRLEGALPQERILIAENAPFLNRIPKKYHFLFSLVPQSDVLSLLETKNADYWAVVSYKKGVANSALLCEELVEYMLGAYPERFRLYEQAWVREIVLHEREAVLKVGVINAKAHRIILCTNGFENFTIENLAGPAINSKFHLMVEGKIGYMAGFLEPLSKPPTAISYFHTLTNTFEDPYFYVTRRPYDVDGFAPENLICIGGPERDLTEEEVYSTTSMYPEDKKKEVDAFLETTYPKGEASYSFLWHGLMGYTKNGVRLIGPEPLNPVLLYNLGCNGVGLLPSIFGGKRIAEFLLNKKLARSIFDPKNQAE